MGTLSEIKEEFHKELNRLYSKEEISSFFFISLEALLNRTRLDFVQDRYFRPRESQHTGFKHIIHRLKACEPIQYILGETEFYGLKFKVNNEVLIPRQETEELIGLILRSEIIHQSQPLKILELGTGSGCIAITLKKLLNNSQVFATDIHSGALEIAQENAQINGVELCFKEHDILGSYPLPFMGTDGKPINYDLIVSNPPYVRSSERNEIEPNVLNYEPHLALFVEDENPLVFYDAISEMAISHLNRNGLLFFEINQYLGTEMKNLLQSKGFTNIAIIKDLFGNDRMVKAQLK
jgi:release factor glutamine methyltransferase